MTTKTNKTKEISIISTLSVNNDNQIITSSLDIAHYFGKQHKDIIKKIEQAECSNDFSQRNFSLAEYIDTQGKPRKSYQITRDGFFFAALGFTGKKAAQFREAYINAFNEMLQQISSQPQISSNVVDITVYCGRLYIHSHNVAALFNVRHIDIMEQIKLIKKIGRDYKNTLSYKLSCERNRLVGKDGYLLDKDSFLLLNLQSNENSIYLKLRVLKAFDEYKYSAYGSLVKEIEGVKSLFSKLEDNLYDKAKELSQLNSKVIVSQQTDLEQLELAADLLTDLHTQASNIIATHGAQPNYSIPKKEILKSYELDVKALSNQLKVISKTLSLLLSQKENQYEGLTNLITQMISGVNITNANSSTLHNGLLDLMGSLRKLEFRPEWSATNKPKINEEKLKELEDDKTFH